MSREVDEHQHELAALQDAQRQKMADFTRRHREELAEYEERIEELEEQMHAGESPTLTFVAELKSLEYICLYFFCSVLKKLYTSSSW